MIEFQIGHFHFYRLCTLFELTAGDNLQPVVNAGLKEPEDVAVDWVARNIYITDARLNKIIVCNMDGSICTTLFDDVHLPRALALDPQSGYMYWTEWGNHVSNRGTCIKRD